MRSWLLLVLAGLISISSTSSRAEPPATPRPAVVRLVFNAYDGDPLKSTTYEKFSFQFGTPDMKQPPEFLKLGDLIPNTHLKLIAFVFKEAWNVKLGRKEDVSELTIADEESGKLVVLPLKQMIEAPAMGQATK